MAITWSHSLTHFAVLHCPETPAEHGHWEQIPDGTESIEIDTVAFPRPLWARHPLVADNAVVRLPIPRQAFRPTNLTVQRSDGEVAQVWARDLSDPTLAELWQNGLTV